jgi:hypothetical protein
MQAGGNEGSSSRSSVILLLLRDRGLLDVGGMRRTKREDAAAPAARFVLVRRESSGVYEGPHGQTPLGSSVLLARRRWWLDARENMRFFGLLYQIQYFKDNFRFSPYLNVV